MAPCWGGPENGSHTNQAAAGRCLPYLQCYRDKAMEGWLAAMNREGRDRPTERQEGRPGVNVQLGLALEIVTLGSFFFGFPQILFYILNTNGKEDLNQLECWAETNTMKWNRDKCKALYFI